MTAFISPVEGRAQGGAGAYGRRVHPVTGKVGDFHGGLDIACPTGTPIVAPEPGRIIFAGWAGSGLASYRSGLCVILRGDRTGVDWYFGHNSENEARTGQRVAAGDLLALSGATGNVSGPHVHLEIRTAGTTTTRDPAPFMRSKGITPGAAPNLPTKGSTPAEKDDDMPRLTDSVPLTGLASTILSGKKAISYAGAVGYAAAAGWSILQNLPALVRDVAALRSEVAALRKEIKR